MSADIHRDAFIQEANELLDTLEESLMELENEPENEDTVAKVFRAMHTIKGSGAMFGFDNIAEFVHGIETAYDKVRDHELKVDLNMVSNSLKSCDIIKEMIHNSNLNIKNAEVKTVANYFSSLCGLKKKEEKPKKENQKNKDFESFKTYRIRFTPDESILLRGVNPELLLSELCELGESKIIAQTNRIPLLNNFAIERCYTTWDIILTTNKGENAIKDVFIFVEDDCKLEITVIDDLTMDENETEYKMVGEILIEKGDITRAEIENILNGKKKLGEILIASGKVQAEAVQSALLEQQHVKEVRAKKIEAENNASIRVSSEKLDFLVDLVGELVTVQARLSQTSANENNPELLKIAEEVERLVWDLRDNTMSIRMLQIGSTFSKFKRLVRDLSLNLGKEIDLVTEGADTELDKTVIEKLNDPLVHLIRNSIDHGIELPDEREKAGKERKGTILLSAKHSGDSVLIQIKDDGKGLDLSRLRAKAIEKGIISENTELTEKETCELIFAPGFSTADKVSNISGRGVGMDVVRRNIEALRGTIDIISEKGSGTVISLKLPLTLAIIDGLLIQISDQFFIIPLSIVEECIELTQKNITDAHGRDIIQVRGDLVPYIKLRELFGFKDAKPSIQQIVITEIDNKRVGFVVDSVIGDHQTVIKSLGKAFKKVHGISGATVLGDGSVALIIDILKIYSGIE